MTKKTQAWGLDLLIGLAIFSIAAIIFFIYSINYSNSDQENFENLINDGNFIADMILSEGSPQNWDIYDVQAIGILSENKINSSKIEIFYNLSNSDYEKTKKIFNTQNNYFFLLNVNMTLGGESIVGIGKQNSENVSNLIKISRYTIYNNAPVNAYVYIWN